MIEEITNLINFDLKNLKKPYKEVVEEKLKLDDNSIKVGVLEYGIKHCGKRYPKEKLFLEKINYNNLINFNELFNFNKLLIFWYKDYIITDIEIYDIELDLTILKEDYNFIKHMIQTKEARLISEGDTQYLGAALSRGKTKISNKNVRNREFVLKKKYLQVIINELGYTCKINHHK